MGPSPHLSAPISGNVAVAATHASGRQFPALAILANGSLSSDNESQGAMMLRLATEGDAGDTTDTTTTNTTSSSDLRPRRPILPESQLEQFPIGSQSVHFDFGLSGLGADGEESMEIDHEQSYASPRRPAPELPRVVEARSAVLLAGAVDQDNTAEVEAMQLAQRVTKAATAMTRESAVTTNSILPPPPSIPPPSSKAAQPPTNVPSHTSPVSRSDLPLQPLSEDVFALGSMAGGLPLSSKPRPPRTTTRTPVKRRKEPAEIHESLDSMIDEPRNKDEFINRQLRLEEAEEREAQARRATSSKTSPSHGIKSHKGTNATVQKAPPPQPKMIVKEGEVLKPDVRQELEPSQNVSNSSSWGNEDDEASLPGPRLSETGPYLPPASQPDEEAPGPRILVEGTPTDTAHTRSSGLPPSEPPSSAPRSRYPPGTDHDHPPFMRPTSSPGTSERMWTEPSQPATQSLDVQDRLQVPSTPGLDETSGPALCSPGFISQGSPPPSTPNRPTDITHTQALVTPTQQLVPTRRILLARKVSPKSLNAMKSAGSEGGLFSASVSKGSFTEPLKPVVGAAKALRSPPVLAGDGEDDGVRVNVLGSAFAMVDPKEKGKGKGKAPSTDTSREVTRDDSGNMADDDTMEVDETPSNTTGSTPPVAFPTKGKGKGKPNTTAASGIITAVPEVLAPATRSPLPPVTPSRVSKVAGMKRKSNMSPLSLREAPASKRARAQALPVATRPAPRPPLPTKSPIKAPAQTVSILVVEAEPESSQDIPLASLPQVTKGRGRKSHVIRPSIIPAPASAAIESDTESEMDVDVDGATTVNPEADDQDEAMAEEAEVSDAIPEAPPTSQEVPETESEAEAEVEEEEDDAVLREALENSSDDDDDASSSASSSEHEDNSDDETYKFSQNFDPESQVPGPGIVDVYGIKRKIGSYASVSPSKASRKRARDRKVAAAKGSSSRPSGRKSQTRASKAKAAPEDDEDVFLAPAAPATPEDQQFRVFAEYGGTYYLGRVTGQTKTGLYNVKFDDGDEVQHPYTKLFAPVVVGDRVKISLPPHRNRRAVVKSLAWVGDQQKLTLTLESDGTVLKVGSEHICKPKNEFDSSRRINPTHLADLGKATRSPRSSRSHSRQVSSTINGESSRKAGPSRTRASSTVAKPAPRTRRSTARASTVQAEPHQSSLPPPPSALYESLDQSLAPILPTHPLPPSQTKDCFTRIQFVFTGVAEEEKEHLAAMIARGGGKVRGDWTDLISFGKRRQHIKWRGRSETANGTILLLAKEPSATYKYMVALALGIPVVSTRWIVDRLQRTVPWYGYLLAAGPSHYLDKPVTQVIDNRWLDDQESVSLSPSPLVRQPLHNMRILILMRRPTSQSPRYQNVDKRFENARVLLAAGADAVDVESSLSHLSGSDLAYDYVITDPAHQDLVRGLQRAGVESIATLHWVRQTVICGTPQPLPLFPNLVTDDGGEDEDADTE